jgi:hypothetical protein
VKLEPENGNVQGEGKEKDEKKYIGSVAMLVVETTINFSRIIKEKEKDMFPRYSS